MKLLLYCTKNKWRLFFDKVKQVFTLGKVKSNNDLNGKIVAECDYEVEWYDTSWCCGDFIEHKGLEKSCLTKEQLFDYVKGRNEFYAIHIKNLHIFDEPRELSDYIHPFISCSNYEENNFIKSFCRNVCSHNKDGERLNVWCDRNENWLQPITKAPQNMMRVKSKDDNQYILISIKPEWLCKILNKEKTIEVRKKVLKEMLKNE